MIPTHHPSPDQPDYELVAITERDGVRDCAHYGSAVLVDRRGDVRWGVGNPRLLVFERSTTKPLRALAVVRSGCVEHFDLDEADIALIAGSPSGTWEHVGRAMAILQKIGVAEGNLQCGYASPLARMLSCSWRAATTSCLHFIVTAQVNILVRWLFVDSLIIR